MLQNPSLVNQATDWKSFMQLPAWFKRCSR